MNSCARLRKASRHRPQWTLSEELKAMESIAMMPGEPRRRATGGRIVLTNGNPGPFKAILVYEDGHTSEHPFQSLQEGEAFLRGHNAMI